MLAPAAQRTDPSGHNQMRLGPVLPAGNRVTPAVPAGSARGPGCEARLPPRPVRASVSVGVADAACPGRPRDGRRQQAE